jgi:predicted flavoprotein YhiN
VRWRHRAFENPGPARTRSSTRCASRNSGAKNISITCQDKTIKGEVVLTKFGIEGSGIYPLSPFIRNELKNKNSKAIIHIDFKPQLSIENITNKINEISRTLSYSDGIKRVLNLSNYQIQLLKVYLSKEEFLNPNELAQKIKSFKLVITECGEIEDAISAIGGIDLSEINENFELNKLPNHFVIGEMLDYDAPTGGYLLQSCFSMGKFVADYLNKKNLDTIV